MERLHVSKGSLDNVPTGPGNRPISYQDWASLRIFLEIARALSFTRAAERLCVSQPTVSRQIAQLERRYGVKLVLRTSRSVKLTAEGLELANRLSMAAQSIEATLTSERPVENKLTTLRLGLFQVPQVALTRHLTDQHREWDCHWETTSPEQGVHRVANGELDVYCGVWCADVLPIVQEGLRYLSIVKVPLWVSMSAGHPLATVSGLTVADLGDAHWVSPADRHLREAFHLACERAEIRPKVRVVTDDPTETAAVLEANLAVAMITPWAARTPALLARPCGGAPEFSLVTATRAASPLSLRKTVAEAARSTLWRSAMADRGLQEWLSNNPQVWTMTEVQESSAGRPARSRGGGHDSGVLEAGRTDPGHLANSA